jgi:PAS domain S-box-containing protein
VRSRVLVIDDNHDLAESVREVLVQSTDLGPLEVTVAHDAKLGLELVKARPFDVAIVDVKLPGASGLDLIAPLRGAETPCEVILLTGNATVESAIRALRLGAAGFVLKSFRPEELVATVRQSLQTAALRREREKYERRYHALVNAADVLVVGVDERGNVVFFNPKLAETLGVPESDAVGRPFANTWVDEPDRRRFETAHADALAGEPVTLFEVGMVDAEGAIRRVRWHLSGVGEDASNLPDHVYAIGVDVTARRALERRAANAEALNAMAPLAMGLAHEIRNPLNAAVLELHLLGRAIERIEDVGARDPMRRRVEIVVSEIRRLERLLTEFLELARPREQKRELVDIGRVVGDVLDLEAEAFSRCQVGLTRDLITGSLVLGDVEKLKQVVLNLVVNALDVMAEGGGSLRVAVRREGDSVMITVTDSGKGIDPRILAEVFDPFFTTKPAGTGLGLAIVRKIVEQHGGRVSLASRPGEGTTVTVALPVAAAQATQTQKGAPIGSV